jgi:serine/threonine-protein kinase ATR
MARQSTLPVISNSTQPPPSTLAAQILRNKTGGSAQRNQSRNDNFDKLLQEFLADPVIETGSEKISENARFITFLADAAVEYRQQNEPFTPNQGKQQALDCLRAIQITIDRHFDVLFFNAPNESNKDAQPPLLLSITTSLLSLGLKESNFEVLKAIVRVLTQIFKSLRRKPEFLDTHIAFQKLIDTTVSNLLSSLEDLSDSFEDTKASFSASFPSLDAMRYFWEPVEKTIALPAGYQGNSTRPMEVCNIVLLLITTSLEIHLKSSNSADTFAVQQCQSEILHWLQRLQISHMKLTIHRCLDRRKLIAYQADLLGQLGSSLAGPYVIQHWLDLVSQTMTMLRSFDIEEVQICLAKCILLARGLLRFQDKTNPGFEMLSSTLIQLLKSFDIWPKLGPEFQTSIKLFLAVYHEHHTLPSKTYALLEMNEIEKLQPFTNPILQEVFLARSISNSQARSHYLDEHVNKRLKTGKSSAGLIFQTTDDLVEHITTLLLQASSDASFVDLDVIDYSLFSTLDEELTLELLKVMKHVPCKLMNPSFSVELGPDSSRRCYICDSTISSQTPRGSNAAEPAFQPFYQLLCRFVELPALKNSKAARIHFLQCISRLVHHINGEEYTTMTASPLGQYSIKAFQSSTREIRFTACRAFLPYLRDDLPQPIKNRNRSTVIKLLKVLNQKDNLAVKEACVALWSLVGQICGESELNLALLELVDALGHPHPIISGAAFQEICAISSFHEKEPALLFRPFWRSIAPGLVKDVIRQPQKCRQLAELLGLKGGINELLVLTQSDTIPFLVITKEYDILTRVAQANGLQTIQELVTGNPRLIACVMARALLESPGSERGAEALLEGVFPEIKDRFTNLLKVDSILTACEILKAARDNPESAQKVHRAFDLLAELFVHGSSGHKAREVDLAVSDFIYSEGLGIMAHFTEIVEHSRERALSDRRSALKAIEHFIKISSVHVEAFLPQVRATLQSALETPALVNEAFAAWIELLNSIPDNNVTGVIPHTFAIVADKWNDFDEATQSKAKSVLEGMMELHKENIIDNIAYIPDLADIKGLELVSQAIMQELESLELHVTLEAFSSRIKDDHIIVVRHSLRELLQFLKEYQTDIHDEALKPQPLAEVSQLYRALLDVILRFKEHDESIVDLCSQCIGVLGVTDPNQVESIKEKHSLLLLYGFDKGSDVVDFIAHMLQSVMVEAFRSAPSGRQQSYFAYVMQELLKISGIRDAIKQRARGSPPKTALARWEAIPETIQNTLMPYLDTKYVVVNNTTPDGLPQQYPPSGVPPSHATWLRSFVYHFLFCGGKDNHAKHLFKVIAKVINGHDLSVAAFLLPFVIQNAVADSSDHVKFLQTEMNNILNFDTKSLSADAMEEVKQCSEVCLTVLLLSSLIVSEYLPSTRLSFSMAAIDEWLPAVLSVP